MITTIQELETIAREVRRRDLLMVHNAGMGHLGGDFSCTEILVALYFNILRVDPQDPDWPDRDRFVMSKGHSSGALYITMALAGFFPVEELDTYMRPLSRLNGHPSRGKLPGIEASTGPLGHGLAVGVGMALGAKMDRASWRTFVLMGDGELQEGSNWEAAMNAAHHGLDNLIVIVDRNLLQQGAPTEDTVRLEPLRSKWEAFGWAVREIDGHDLQALVKCLGEIPIARGKPSCVIAHTHKGYGISFMQDKVEWHHRVPSDAEVARALQELTGGVS